MWTPISLNKITKKWSSDSAWTIESAAILKKCLLGIQQPYHSVQNCFCQFNMFKLSCVQAVESGPNLMSRPHIWTWLDSLNTSLTCQTGRKILDFRDKRQLYTQQIHIDWFLWFWKTRKLAFVALVGLTDFSQFYTSTQFFNLCCPDNWHDNNCCGRCLFFLAIASYAWKYCSAARKANRLDWQYGGQPVKRKLFSLGKWRIDGWFRNFTTLIIYYQKSSIRQELLLDGQEGSG